eukprot:Tamp_10120.p4 GENE.Tamp_10120~~Tamp_10120.p4  ORF type:complete len:143 (+),score=27.44 Tamp_10120:717-1145(+)
MHPVDACPQARLNMKPAGVGIVFQREETLDHNGLVVDSLAPGGPAECSKMVEPGDRLITINGKSIRGLDARSIARLILGPMDSSVELVFECKDTSPPQRKTVVLTRNVQLVENAANTQAKPEPEPAPPAPAPPAPAEVEYTI